MSAWLRLLARLRLVAAGSLLAVALAGCGQGPTALAPGNVDDDLLLADAAGDGGAIRAYFNDAYGDSIQENEPKARANPYNTDKSLYKLLRSARSTLDVAIYDLEDIDVAKAFVAAKRRGVRVRIVTDSDNMAAGGGHLRDSIRDLRAAGITVREDRRSAIMHNKFVIVDGRAVWTGSTNATPRSLYWHNNNAIVLRSEALAATYTRVFQQYFEDGSFGPASTLFGIQDSAGVSIGNATVQPFFSPKGNGKAAVLAELKGAQKSIRFMTFSLTDGQIGNSMVAKARAGLEVEGVFDAWLAAGEYSLFESFRRRGLDVLRDGNQALMHHKVILVDDRTVITGSYNYSENAETANNENFLIIRGAPAISRAYLGEYKRVSRAARYNHPPSYSPQDPEATIDDK